MRASASKFSLLQDCQYWARDDAKWFDPSGPSATIGTEFHEECERQIRAKDLNVRYQCVEQALNLLPGAFVSAEWAVGIDLKDGTCALLNVENRQYPKGFLCGTADLVLVDKTTIAVIDWKTGKESSTHMDQVKLLAAMFSMATGGFKDAIASLFYVNLDGTVRVVRTEQVHDPAPIVRTAYSLAMQANDSGPWPGSHCVEKWCPHAAYCSEGDEPMSQLMDDKLVITDANASEAVVFLHLLKKRLERAESDLKQIARSNGGVVVDGKVYTETFQKSSSFVQSRALELLKDKGASKEEIESLYSNAVRSGGFRLIKRQEKKEGDE